MVLAEVSERKILDIEATAKTCKNIEGFFAATVPDESRAVVPLVPEAVAAPAVPEVIYDEDFYFDIATRCEKRHRTGVGYGRREESRYRLNPVTVLTSLLHEEGRPV